MMSIDKPPVEGNQGRAIVFSIGAVLVLVV